MNKTEDYAIYWKKKGQSQWTFYFGWCNSKNDLKSRMDVVQKRPDCSEAKLVKRQITLSDTTFDNE